MPRLRPHLLYALLLLSLLAACTQPTTDPVDPVPPRVPDLPAGTWTPFSPGGDTTCSDGSPYTFYVYPGSVNKVVIDFEGGGACWSDGTCGEGGPYQPNVSSSQSFLYREETPSGLYDKTNPRNPVRDWYHVFVSYCTADVHLGDSEVTYATPDGERTLQHRGQRNVAAVLDWVFAAFGAPESVFVTGCSAGAYGAALSTSRIAAQYPDAEVSQLGDCGAGIIPESFVEEGLSHWNVADALPEGVGLGEGVPATFLADAYVATGEAYPETLLAQYNSALDSTQIAFYALQQGVDLGAPGVVQAVGEDWFTKFVSSLQTIDLELDNFYFYTSLLDEDDTLENGTAHCILWRPEFYTLATSGVSFASWLGDLVNGREGRLRSVSPPFSALPVD